MKSKKTVLITGSSRGIGRAIAILFARNNYNVVINYNKSEDKAKELYDMLTQEGLSVRIFKADVSKIEEANALVNYTIGQFENIDVLINNAGISKPCLFTDISYEQWNEVISTNLNSVFYVTKKALQYMLPNCSGHIINISSMWGLVGGSSEVDYSASKAGMIGLTKALAKELAPSHISVNGISFGVIDTDMNRCFDEEERAALSEEIPYGRFASPEEAAAFCYQITESPEYLTGQIIRFDGGWI